MTRILLWGDTQTGKTSLVSAAFCADPSKAPRDVDMRASHAEISRHLFHNFNSMNQGRPVPATQETSVHVTLTDTAGQPLVIEDIRGGIIQTIEDEDVRQILEGADAYLVLIEWQGQNRNEQLNAIRGAWNMLAHKPRALVFTKCDRDATLRPDDPIWDKPAEEWFQRVDWLRPYHNLLALFDNHIFLSSAVGYHEESGEPALLLGEFGQLIPFRVRPRNVVEPLDLLIRLARNTP